MGDNAKFTLLKDEALLRSEFVGVSVADTNVCHKTDYQNNQV